eukprot:660427-Lingulodinium_polyedra.AAC.1
MTNAFGSTKHSELKEVIGELAKEEDRHFMEQRISRVVAVLATPQGDLGWNPQEGAPMGTGEAPKYFMGAFCKCIRGWNQEQFQEQKSM